MITKKAEYGISALVGLALAGAGGGFVASRQIASAEGIPPNLIAQIFAKLRRAGLVKGARGPAGGVKLARDPSRITLREVVEVFDGPFGITRCLVQEDLCENQPSCPLRNVWANAQAEMLRVLESVTIDDLANAKRSLGSRLR